MGKFDPSGGRKLAFFSSNEAFSKTILYPRPAGMWIFIAPVPIGYESC
jgi:hypothetical protein